MNPEERAVAAVADMMALSARTAPKGKGADSIRIRVKQGSDIAVLSAEMRSIGEEMGIGFFIRDAGNVEACDACVLIGCEGGTNLGLNCGGCGFQTCAAMKEEYQASISGAPFSGPNCVIKMADLGIAVGSAVKTASIHNVDNRIMYSAGVAALRLGWLDTCSVAYGIPLKAGGKNIFFDR
ncbi:hypothetical protein AZH53_02355 [Methanomicrobiaceae archaeon CYW5]|uniref:ferredoxin domain-containing protein n=1 Tax=Methanovulcanius yangii TaxID=1789227 RepID=UPI0029CA29D2|nr:DUF2148 domain-containing protein [Methanovulcanius yangii]MBT8507272.1 hypothetical protein [Methanovulcanius yangii]